MTNNLSHKNSLKKKEYKAEHQWMLLYFVKQMNITSYIHSYDSQHLPQEKLIHVAASIYSIKKKSGDEHE